LKYYFFLIEKEKSLAKDECKKGFKCMQIEMYCKFVQCSMEMSSKELLNFNQAMLKMHDI